MMLEHHWTHWHTIDGLGVHRDFYFHRHTIPREEVQRMVIEMQSRMLMDLVSRGVITLDDDVICIRDLNADMYMLMEVERVHWAGQYVEDSYRKR